MNFINSQTFEVKGELEDLESDLTNNNINFQIYSIVDNYFISDKIILLSSYAPIKNNQEFNTDLITYSKQSFKIIDNNFKLLNYTELIDYNQYYNEVINNNPNIIFNRIRLVYYVNNVKIHFDKDLENNYTYSSIKDTRLIGNLLKDVFDKTPSLEIYKECGMAPEFSSYFKQLIEIN